MNNNAFCGLLTGSYSMLSIYRMTVMLLLLASCCLNVVVIFARTFMYPIQCQKSRLVLTLSDAQALITAKPSCSTICGLNNELLSLFHHVACCYGSHWSPQRSCARFYYCCVVKDDASL